MYSILSLTLSTLLISNTRAQCPNQPDSTVVGLKVQYDIAPDETLLQVKTYSGSVTTTNIALNENVIANAYKEVNVCVGRETLNEIVIKDSGGNGFFGSGYAALSVNERLLATVSDFGDEVSYMFYADRNTCNSDEIPFVLDIKYDSNPEAITWSLTDTGSGSVIISNENVGRAQYLKNKFLTVTQCVSVDNKVYQFSLTDIDGLNAPAFYRVFADYDLIKVGQDFAGESKVEFTLDGSTTPIPITLSPTTVPPVPVPVTPNSCVDNYQARFIGDDNQEQPCVWFDTREEKIAEYCTKNDVKAACPYTCGVCTDPGCEDSPKTEKFALNGSGKYTCQFIRQRLSTRGKYDQYFNDYCVGDNGADFCPKSCKTCS